MKRPILKLMAILAVLSLSLFAVQALACDHAAGKECGCKHAADKAPAASSASDPAAQPAAKAPTAFDKAPAVGTKATCPVSGEEFSVTKDTVNSQYKGKFYVFCCSGCKPKFDADPTKYIK